MGSVAIAHDGSVNTVVAARTDKTAHPLLRAEVAVVVALVVGLSAARSVLSFVRSALTAPPAGLPGQTVALNGSAAPGLPWVDLGYQVIFVVSLLLPVALVLVLAAQRGEAPDQLGLRMDRWPRDTLLGIGAAAAVGGVGLVGYLGSRAAGASLTVIPTTLPDVWWRIPVLIASAFANALLEEVVIVGYLLRRCKDVGINEDRALAISGGVRAAYHLYQGLAGLLGNLLMGLIFGRYYQRTGRVLPLIVAHATIDTAAFVGYVILAGHVSWLPTG